MAHLDKDLVTTVVKNSLKAIADLPSGNINNTPLDMLNDDQKQIFASSLKINLNAVPYLLSNGSTLNTVYYDVPLTMATVNSWATVGDCINWVTDNQITVDKN